MALSHAIRNVRHESSRTIVDFDGEKYQAEYGIYCTADIRLGEKRDGVPTVVVSNPNKPVKYAMMLHGLGAGDSTYHVAIEELLASLRETDPDSSWVLIAPVEPGFCGTDLLGSDKDNFVTHSLWREELVKSLHRDGVVPDRVAFHVLGHSMGASMGVKYAEMFPDRVKSLVLINGAPGGAIHKFDDRSPIDLIKDLASHYDIALHGARDMFKTARKGLIKTLVHYIGMMMADPLSDELDALGARGIDVYVFESDRDFMVPNKNIAAQIRQLNVSKERVGHARGHHTWLLRGGSGPRFFGKRAASFIRDVEFAAELPKLLSVRNVNPLGVELPYPGLTVVPDSQPAKAQ